MTLVGEANLLQDDQEIIFFPAEQNLFNQQQYTETLLDENIVLNDEDVIEAIAHATINKKILFKRIFMSSVAGLGTGLAMMPIFNAEVRNLDNFGIDIHDSIAAFSISTINTLIVSSVISATIIYNSMKEESLDIEALPRKQQLMIDFGRTAAICSTVFPLSLLWQVELHDQQVANSSGFDEFMAWATFTTMPLIICKTLESFDAVKDFAKNEHKQIELKSSGSKLTVYGLSSLSITGRFISYTAAAYSLGSAMGLGDDVALTAGIAVGGVCGSGIVGLAEYLTLKSLFKERTTAFSKKEVLAGALTTLEGIWFTMPLVSTGINYTKSWNPFITGALYTPLFISHAICESSTIYNNIKKLKWR
jgi:hypothetical protein